MLKQLLNRIPRKFAKDEQFDVSEKDCSKTAGTINGEVQYANIGSTISSKLDVVKRVSSVVFPSSFAIGVEIVEPHISFNDISNLQKQNLFVSKLNFCCEGFDESEPGKFSNEKDHKRQAMVEILDFVSSGSAKLTEPVIAAMSKICATHIFRVFPPKHRFEEADDESVFNPSWPNLQIVYNLLLQFISHNSLDTKVAKKYIDHSFILKLLDLFDSEDPRERDCLKGILHIIYRKFMVHRAFIRKAVSNIIYRFVFETDRHNGIAELLEIFGSVISGFSLPLKEEHMVFLFKALIPLHKPKSLGVYHHQLSFCVLQFIDKDPKLASSILKGLLKYWPVTNSQKELMFLNELEEILEATIMSEFHKVMVPLFRRIGCCLNSFHYQVAERTHMLWNNEHIFNLILNNQQVIVPLVVPALEKNIQNHWNKTVLNMTRNVKAVFCEMDRELVLSCQQKLEENLNISAVVEQHNMSWKRLETAASSSPPSRSILVPVEPATCSVAC